MAIGKFKIGELSRQTGVTIRTLRYYEEIGLLKPSERMDSGYRLYGLEEIEQLQHIMSLKQLGLSLDEIHTCLNDPEFSPEDMIRRQLKQLKEEIAVQKQLYRQLEILADFIQRSEKISIDELIKTIQIMKTYEKYYASEQMDYLEKRREEIGDDRIHAVEQEWAKLIGEVRTEIEKGTDPFDDTVQALAQRWQALLREFTGGDPGIQQSLNTMFKNEDTEEASQGAFDREVMDYIIKAMKAGKDK